MYTDVQGSQVLQNKSSFLKCHPLWLGRISLEISLKYFQRISVKIIFSFSSPGGVTGWLKQRPVPKQTSVWCAAHTGLRFVGPEQILSFMWACRHMCHYFPSKCSLDMSDDAKGKPNNASFKAVENEPLLLCETPKKNFCLQGKVLSACLSVPFAGASSGFRKSGLFLGPLKSQCQGPCSISDDLCGSRGTFGGCCQFLAVVIALGV